MENNNQIIGTFCEKCRNVMCTCKPMSNKAPKKIYIYKEQENYYVLNEQCLGNIEVDKVIFTSHEMIPYILESEHNRIIDELISKIELQSKLYLELIEMKGATEYPPLESLELIRSFISISEREGKDTNWDGVNVQCKRIIELNDKRDEFLNQIK